MEKISQKKLPSPWPEIVFGSSDSKTSQSVHRALQEGVLKKIAPRLYTSNLKEAPEKIVKRYLYHILGHFFPGAVLSHRTALEGGPSPQGLLVLTYKYTRTLQFPGIQVRLIKGAGHELGDTPFMKNLFLASRERALLENLQPSRQHQHKRKNWTRASVEEYLEKLCQNYGIEELNRIRDKAKPLASRLGMEREFHLLESIIGALQGTRESHWLVTDLGLSRYKNQPYDKLCLDRLAKLALSLQTDVSWQPIDFSSRTSELNHIAFFEAYFSNYIEGTEFEIEEAADIIFRGKLSPYPPEDAHDILGTFKIVSSLEEMKKTPKSKDDLLSIMKNRHFELLSARKNKNPGHFKNKPNRAGNTLFVNPDLVEGTLIKGFDLYQNINPGMPRAVFMMFFISEIHPFLDGNGRIARIMMNAELVSVDECRIIIPTVYRDDYLFSLRRLSRQDDSDPYIRMLKRAQQFTASIDYTDYSSALAQLQKTNAFQDPSEAKLIF